mmetsp:Transcript_78040/g.135314  ORF Transcript_78040/g.135314 Transcript_78040/m.135314 type:complete len:273 (-) Transcript_78040:22-840(-)
MADSVGGADKDADAEKHSKSMDWVVNVCPPLLFCITVLIAVGILSYVGWDNAAIKVFEAAESSENTYVKALLINALLVCMIVLCLPGPALLIILNGFFFKFWRGLLFAFLAELIAYLTSIWLARTCLKSRVRNWIASNEQLNEVVRVCEQDSMGRFLVLMRFVALPVWIKNYTMGVLEISILKCVLVFIPGDLFVCGIFVYVGSKGHAIAGSIRRGEPYTKWAAFSGVELIVGGVSITMIIVMCVLGWSEYRKRRDALPSEAHSLATPLRLA